MSCPFWRVLANLERFLQAKTRCHSVRVSYSPLSFFQLSWVAMLRTTYSLLFWAVLASAFCPRRPMRMTLLNMVFSSVSFGFVRCLRYMLAQRACRRDPLPRRLDRICGRGPQLAWGQESA